MAVLSGIVHIVDYLCEQRIGGWVGGYVPRRDEFLSMDEHGRRRVMFVEYDHSQDQLAAFVFVGPKDPCDQIKRRIRF